MQQARHQLAAHAFAQRELAHRLLGDLGELERLHELRAARAVLARLELVDPRQEVERIRRGQVLPELRALAEHGPDLVAELPAVAAGLEPGDAHAPRARAQDARQHLQGRRLARAVGADERDALARLDGERHTVDRDDVARARRDQRAQRPDEPVCALPHPEHLAQPLELDRGHTRPLKPNALPETPEGRSETLARPSGYTKTAIAIAYCGHAVAAFASGMRAR